VPRLLALLTGLTGSEECARELVIVSNEIEERMGPEAALTRMPPWVC